MRAQRAVTVFFENWKSKDALKAAVWISCIWLGTRYRCERNESDY